MNEETEEDIAERRRTGGPAFPWDGMGDDGMTLRDYFAAKAMQGLLAHPKCGDVGNGSEEAQIRTTYVSAESYAVADAMLKERAK